MPGSLKPPHPSSNPNRGTLPILLSNLPNEIEALNYVIVVLSQYANVTDDDDHRKRIVTIAKLYNRIVTLG